MDDVRDFNEFLGFVKINIFSSSSGWSPVVSQFVTDSHTCSLSLGFKLWNVMDHRSVKTYNRL